MTDGQRSAAEMGDAFGHLANELRVEILLALWDERRKWEGHREQLSFTTLQSRVGLHDSGKFNYHLGVLVPEFVRKTDDGYVLTHAGRTAVAVVASGSFTDTVEAEADAVPAGECLFCGDELHARYEDGRVVVDCTACDELIVGLPIPPVTVASADPDALAETFSRHVLGLATRLGRGFCTLCHGHVDATLTARSSEKSVTYRSALDVRFECRACGDRTNLNVGAVVMDHPAVLSLLFDAGIDLRDVYVWEFVPLLDPDETIVSEDPLRLRLEITVDGDTLELTLDESATVIEHTRR